MATEERQYGPATQVALDHLATLKPEHQRLLETLLADRGMASATLESLVEHLLEEEGPQLQSALTRAKGSSSAKTLSSSVGPSGATVGSLRPLSAAEFLPRRGTVGSLRK